MATIHHEIYQDGILIDTEEIEVPDPIPDPVQAQLDALTDAVDTLILDSLGGL